MVNQKFEYYIKKIINKILLQLICAILILAILAVNATIFRFYIGSYFAPHIYILLGMLILAFIFINYLLYKKQLWLLNNYSNDPINVELKIRQLINKKESFYLNFHLFYKATIDYYHEALKILQEIIEDKNE